MYGVFKFLSFIAIYYVLASALDLYGTYKSYRSNLNPPDGKEGTPKFELSLSLDLLVISIIYLVSYYLGVFYN